MRHRKSFKHRLRKLVHRTKEHIWRVFKAFSLIELLVVFTIIILLATYAVSTYKYYVVKSQVYSALELLKELQTKVIKYYEINGKMPSAAEIPNVYNPTNLISLLAVENNGGINNIYVVKIHATFSSEANQELAGKSIFIEGKVKNNTWVWLCRHSVGILVIDNAYLPEPCQFTGSCTDLFCLDEQP